MTQPQPLIDRSQQFIELLLLGGLDLHVHRAAEMQGADILAPGEIEAVIAPPARRLDSHFVVVTAIEGPIVGRNQLFHQIQRIGGRLFFYLGRKSHTRDLRWSVVGMYEVSSKHLVCDTLYNTMGSLSFGFRECKKYPQRRIDWLWIKDRHHCFQAMLHFGVVLLRP